MYECREKRVISNGRIISDQELYMSPQNTLPGAQQGSPVLDNLDDPNVMA